MMRIPFGITSFLSRLRAHGRRTCSLTSHDTCKLRGVVVGYHQWHTIRALTLTANNSYSIHQFPTPFRLVVISMYVVGVLVENLLKEIELQKKNTHFVHLLCTRRVTSCAPSYQYHLLIYTRVNIIPIEHHKTTKGRKLYISSSFYFELSSSLNRRK